MSMAANELDPAQAPPHRGPSPRATTLANRYEIDLDAPISTDTTSLIYAGRDLRTRRDVAIKTLRPEYRNDPAMRARFRREARLLAFVTHPNVVRVFDFVEDRGASWVVLEKLSGRTVQDLLDERGPFPPVEAAWVLDQVAAALGHLHARGLVHLDLTPRSLMVTDDNRLKLSDFGLAQPAGDAIAATDGGAAGPAGYLAPERVSGDPVDVATDVYALGCLVYELVTGQPPAIVAGSGRVGRGPEPPSRLRPDLNLPRWIDETLGWALAKDPAARYGGVEPFARAFRAAADGERMADIATRAPTVAFDVTPQAPAPGRAQVQPRWPGAASSHEGPRGIERLYRTGGRAARRSAGVRGALWRVVAAFGAADALLAIALVLGHGAIPGLYEPDVTLHAGSIARVTVSDSRLRDAPGLATNALWALEPGDRVTVTGPSLPNDGHRWWPVAVQRSGAMVEGYMAADGIAAETPLERIERAVGIG